MKILQAMFTIERCLFISASVRAKAGYPDSVAWFLSGRLVRSFL